MISLFRQSHFVGVTSLRCSSSRSSPSSKLTAGW